MAKKLDYASLYTRRKDGVYVGTYTDATGRHYVYSKDPEVLWHKLNDPKPEAVYTFGEATDAWDRWHTEEIGWKTAEAYKAPIRRLKDQYAERPLNSITAQEVRALLIYYGNLGYSRRTVQMHRDILNMIFNYAIVNGKLSQNPCAAVSMPKNLKSKTREIPDDRAITAVQNGVGAPFGMFAFFLLYTGLRRGEALAIRYEDIDRERKIIRVERAVEFVGNNPHIKTPKTKAGAREVPLLDVLDAVLPEGSGLLFCREDGSLLTKTAYRKRWEKYCETIGVDITAHQLRHGYATILYEAGVQDKDAQLIMGHSSIQVTRDVYTHIRDAQKNKAAAAINNYIASKSTTTSLQQYNDK